MGRYRDALIAFGRASSVWEREAAHILIFSEADAGGVEEAKQENILAAGQEAEYATGGVGGGGSGGGEEADGDIGTVNKGVPEVNARLAKVEWAQRDKYGEAHAEDRR
jgi:hypothetical protein